MKQLNVILIVTALGLAGCAGGGGGSSGSASSSNPIGSQLNFNADTTFTKNNSKQLSYPMCFDASFKETATGIVQQYWLLNGRGISTNDVMTINADNTFTRVITSTDCTATITGTITLNSTTKKAVFSNLHTSTDAHSTCVLPQHAEGQVTGDGTYYNNGDISQTVLQNANPASYTVDYIRVGSDSGIGFYYPSLLTFTGDNSSHCYLYYYSSK